MCSGFGQNYLDASILNSENTLKHISFSFVKNQVHRKSRNYIHFAIFFMILQDQLKSYFGANFINFKLLKYIILRFEELAMFMTRTNLVILIACTYFIRVDSRNTQVFEKRVKYMKPTENSSFRKQNGKNVEFQNELLKVEPGTSNETLLELIDQLTYVSMRAFESGIKPSGSILIFLLFKCSF